MALSEKQAKAAATRLLYHEHPEKARPSEPLSHLSDYSLTNLLVLLQDHYGVDLTPLTPQPQERYRTIEEGDNLAVIDTWSAHNVVARFGPEVPDRRTLAAEVQHVMNVEATHGGA